MIEMDEKMILSKVQAVEMEILDEVVRICKINNLKYYIMYGTLIGAIRHGGFIPWDDDIDIMMPRYDYEKFREICEFELDQKYFFQDYSTDVHYADGNLHVRKKNTVYIINNDEHYRYVCNGIWLDIWALDNLDDNEFMQGKARRQIIKILTKISNKVALADCKDMSIKNKILFYISRPLSLKWLIEVREKLCMKNKNPHSKYLINFSSPYSFEKEKILREDYGEGSLLTFGEKKYVAPKKWDSILKRVYGDYMTPPSKAEQKIYHCPKKVEF